MEEKKETETILIVDDAPQNIAILSELLLGYNLKIAVNGKRAIDILIAKDIPDVDLILLDVNMPILDGFDTCQIIRQNEKLKEIPIIFLTANTDPESIIRGFELGAQDYVASPFNQNELLARIKTHLELKKSREKLSEFNKLLEEQVVERTIELTRAINKLSMLEKAKSDFLALISHELRTPLTSICGLAESLKNMTENNMSAEFIDNLIDSTQKLLKFSETALQITKLKAGIANINFEKNQIERLISHSIAFIQEKYKTKNITVDFNLTGKELFVLGDTVLLEKCFNNIIDNAYKYSTNGSAIYITAREVDECVELTIQDGGSGFADSDLIQRFDLFSAGDMMHHKDGFGLSLAESKLILDAHKGKIEGQNGKQGGAEVKVILPLV
jgi:two-component system, sensor histidine kinase and response regulator